MAASGVMSWGTAEPPPCCLAPPMGLIEYERAGADFVKFRRFRKLPEVQIRRDPEVDPLPEEWNLRNSLRNLRKFPELECEDFGAGLDEGQIAP